MWYPVGLLSVALTRAVASSSIGSGISPQGRTVLLGNSFGRPGYNDTYDYIVIGGGNAGNVIAARLALAGANYSVAVIEAGGFYEVLDGNRTQIPGLCYVNNVEYPIASGTTMTSIGLHTVPQAGYNGRELLTISAQTFGGDTAANNLIYQRATKGAHDKWAEVVGDDFWSWENVYPAYKKSCRFAPPDYTRINPAIDIKWDREAFADEAGPLHVSYGNYWGPDGPYLNAQMEQAGFEQIDGLNSGKLIGYSAFTAALDSRTATRDTSETSFLQAAIEGSAIKIYPNTLAKRITFDGQKRATGVQVQGNVANSRIDWHLTARKEVILSAGAWHSPQLLMASGIGPADTLQEIGVDAIADIPGVGQNEWDQPTIEIMYKVNSTTGTQFQAGNPEVVTQANDEYLKSQSGLLSGFGAGLPAGWEKFPQHLRSQFSNSTLAHLGSFPDDWPEVEFVFLEYSPLAVAESVLGRNIQPDDNFLTAGAVLLATASRGNMTLASADTVDQPLINPNWLADGGDIEQAYATFLRMREIMANSSIVEAEIFPGPGLSKREDILDWLRNNMSHLFHAMCTCKMGRSDDPAAVLDSRARVRGVTGLRVVDASSFPLAPPGHPMAAIYMFAEKIAESILAGN